MLEEDVLSTLAAQGVGNNSELLLDNHLSIFSSLLPINVILLHTDSFEISWSKLNENKELERLESDSFQNIIHPDDLEKIKDLKEISAQTCSDKTFGEIIRLRLNNGDKWKWFWCQVRFMHKVEAFKGYAFVTFQAVTEVLAQDGLAYQLQQKSKLEKRQELKQILSLREIEILEMVSQALTDKEIAQRLNISQSTVTTHRRNLLKKLGVRNKLGLIRIGLKHSLS